MAAPRSPHPLLVAAGAAVTTFGFLSLVVLGLIVGGRVAGAFGGVVGAAVLAGGWAYLIGRGWRRLNRPPS